MIITEKRKDSKLREMFHEHEERLTVVEEHLVEAYAAEDQAEGLLKQAISEIKHRESQNKLFKDQRDADQEQMSCKQ